jgi:hypothetical protein
LEEFLHLNQWNSQDITNEQIGFLNSLWKAAHEDITESASLPLSNLLFHVFVDPRLEFFEVLSYRIDSVSLIIPNLTQSEIEFTIDVFDRNQ